MDKLKKIFLAVIIGIFAFDNNYLKVNAADKDSKYCKMTSAGNVNVIRIRTDVGAEKNKYGYVYNFKINGLNAFCRDMGKTANSSYVYTRGNKVDRGIDSYIYKIYQVYYEHKDASNAADYIFGAQLAVWVYENFSGQGCTVTYTDQYCLQYKFEKALHTAFMLSKLSTVCGGYENTIRNKLNNPDFECDDYMKNLGAINSRSYYDGRIYHELPFYVEGDNNTLSYYNLFNPKSKHNIFDAYGASSASFVRAKTYDMAKNFADEQTAIYSKADKLYEGDLYYWHPPNEADQQVFIGSYECDNVPKSCNTELEDLLKKYPLNVRTANNENYMKDLEELKQKYAELNIEDIANPYCSNCDTDLEKLLKQYPASARNYANAAYVHAVEVLKQKYPGKFNATDIANPRCSITPPTEPPCEPAFDSYACSYSSDRTGFYMSDADNANPNESCYLTKGIAYETESNQKIGSKDEEFSTNPYCDVYCWEAFGAHFPNPLSNIKAGTTFYWGVLDRETGVFGNLNAKRICKTPSINYTQFSTDWSNNETEVLNAYNAYKAQEAYNNQTPQNKGACELSGTCSSVSTATTKCTATPSSSTEGCTGPDGSNPCFKVDCSSGVASESGGCWCSHNSKTTTPGGQCVACSSGTLKNGSCKIDGTKYSKTKTSYGTGINIQYSKDDAEVCIANSVTDKTAAANTALNGDLNSLNQKLVAQIEDRKTISANIEACQSQNIINKDSMYTFNSTVTLNYSDPAGVNRGISSSVQMVRDTARDIVTATGIPGATDGTYTYTCTTTTGFTDTSNKCNTSITKYKTYTWEFQGVWYFKYNQDDYYWQSIVENAHVVNNKTYTADYSGMKIVPYTIGYGIPTAFSLKTGFYEISVDVTGFGNNGTHFEPLVKEEIGSEILNYACPYHVVNELYGKECNFECNFATRTCTLTADSPAYCDNEVKGIDLVYRVIEMASGDTKTIFPSIDGDGRNPGTNWATYIANKSKAYKNITTPSVIYDDEPIYEIDLTPTLINQIRRDNLTYREQNMDPYTSYTDANNQEKVICEGVDTNRTCASHYITTLINQNVLNGEYADCHNCGSTAERLKYIDSMKERYNN